ncbi:MAG: hypothetical protein GEU90_19935 [Gemmatimonas sp.]|nr:hypothetical protein [Gemmatimonas sp.]
MSTQPDTPSSNHPLGGASGEWRHRFFRYHVPLALSSALVLVLFVTLPRFDASAYPHADIFSGTFPQQRSEGGPMDHLGGHAGPMRQRGSHSTPITQDGGRPVPMDGGARQVIPMSHGGGQAGMTRGRGRQAGFMDHSGTQGGPMVHSGDQVGAMDHDGSQTGAVNEGERMGGRGFNRQFTLATGYLALGLLAVTLLIGPANLLLRRRNPVSSYLRRDVGTWTAIFSVVHVVFGLQVHGSGQISGFLNYFVSDSGPLTNSFGLANWTGLAAVIIVVGLLAISNDAALRRLKARPWKWLQRFNYAFFALVVLHAFFYGALLRMTSPFTLLLGLSAIAVFVGQAMGVSLWRRRFSRATATLA